jgi:hypothetical protein
MRPGPQVIIDGSAVRGKALDSKWNRRKCNPNRECGARKSPGIELLFIAIWLADDGPHENNVHAFDHEGRRERRTFAGDMY